MRTSYDPNIADLERRVSGLVFIGKVSKTEPKKHRYRVKAGDIESDWLPMSTSRAGKTKTYSAFTEGEQVVVVAAAGDLSQGVIMGALATDETQAADKDTIHRTVYPDGTVVEYDDEAKAYKMTVAEGGSFLMEVGGGCSVSGSGGTLTFKAPAGVAIESPTLTHNGKDISETHLHTQVMPGPALSGPPQ